MQRGLIFHAPLDSKYGTRDRTPYSNNGTNNGSVIRNHGGYFDGNSYLGATNLNVPISSFSFCGWQKFSEYSYRQTFDGRDSDGNAIFNFK